MLARLNAIHLIKWKMLKYLSGWKRIPGAQEKMKSVPNACKCDDMSWITTQHIEFCRQHTKLRADIHNQTGTPYGELLKNIQKWRVVKGK
jgi:hypothetical protein